LGVLQMSVGVIFSSLNFVKEKAPYKWIDLFTQFIPQIIFLWSIFGYMCVLIILKWVTNWDTNPEGPPPFILPLIIQMFLSPSSPPTAPWFVPHQHGVQIVLTIIALIAPFVMLFPKPYLLRYYRNKDSHLRLLEGDEEGHEHTGGGGGHGHGHGEFDFSEVMIHQVIHTIEYVLGTISNTASYLRLWALSLAHSELSTVFWNRVLMAQIMGGNVALIFVAWAVWAGATFAVLLIMETLSAFLHALRLHWVEFQNKFYVGDGRRFAPFSYAKILAGEDEEDS